jgi:Metallo-beta-lactamase superfamily
VVVDTGVAENREHFLSDVFSLVEPEEIRWVFISHDDVDHTGNLNALMEAAPNATVIVNWFMQQRMGATLDVSPLRQRWVGDGELIDVGDRSLLTVRPPVYDSPTTRGLFDTATGVYWGSDAFATPMLTSGTHRRRRRRARPDPAEPDGRDGLRASFPPRYLGGNLLGIRHDSRPDRLLRRFPPSSRRVRFRSPGS